MAVVSAFAQTLRRYTSLNHLAQAARAVLQNTSQINQMLSDLNRVDFANVQVNVGRLLHVAPEIRAQRRVPEPSLALSHPFLRNVCVCVCDRSRRRGCVSVTRAWFNVWSRILRSRCSSRALWTSGLPGWTMWSLRS